MAKLRFTKAVVEEVLKKNEGLAYRSAPYKGANYSDQVSYLIKGGKVIITTIGKTSWAASRFNEERVADHEQTLRFLRKMLELGKLKTDGLG